MVLHSAETKNFLWNDFMVQWFRPMVKSDDLATNVYMYQLHNLAKFKDYQVNSSNLLHL